MSHKSKPASAQAKIVHKLKGCNTKADLLTELRELENRHLKLLEERSYRFGVYYQVKCNYSLDDWPLFYEGLHNRLN